MNGAKHEHRIGRFVIRMERQGGSFVYDIFRSGLLVACGFDSLSRDEETALGGITDRLYGKGNERAA